MDVCTRHRCICGCFQARGEFKGRVLMVIPVPHFSKKETLPFSQVSCVFRTPYLAVSSFNAHGIFVCACISDESVPSALQTGEKHRRRAGKGGREAACGCRCMDVDGCVCRRDARGVVSGGCRAAQEARHWTVARLGDWLLGTMGPGSGSASYIVRLGRQVNW